MAAEMKTEYRLNIRVSPMDDLANIVCGMDDIPKDELHIKEGSDIAKIIATFPEEISFSLRAINGWDTEKNFTVGYIQEPKLVYREDLENPLAINSLTVERAEDRFTGHFPYKYYNLGIFSPRMDRVPKQDWGLIEFYNNSPNQEKSYNGRFNDLLGYSDEVPEGELHVRADSEHAKILMKAERLEYITSPCYLRLRSWLHTYREDCYTGPTDLDFATYPEMRIRYVENQKRPLLIKRSESERDPFAYFHEPRDSHEVNRYVEIDSAENLKKRLKERR